MTRFYQTLLSNNQYIIAIIYEKTTNLNQQQNTSANFIEIKIPKINVHYVPIFTSIDNANQFLKRFNGLKDKVNVVALPLVPVFDFIVNLDKYSNNNTIDIPDLMLNPHCASVDGLQFTKSKIKKLLAGKFETIERDLLKEDEFPEKLLERLNKEFIEKNKTVVKEVNCKVLDGPDMYFLMEIGLNKESIIGNEEKPVLTNELVQFINETEGIPSLKYPYFVTFNS
ncbi:hypothetical protein ABK040_003550 [Willaertia magna]